MIYWFFYPTDKMEYEQIIRKIKKNIIKILTPKNSYWKENAILIQDSPDGYSVVISNLKMTNW